MAPRLPRPSQRIGQSYNPSTVNTTLNNPVLNHVETRILGALIEKDITTPDYYPLSLNAIINACNQKSNRDPVMSLEESAVRDALVALNEKGLAGAVSSADSRVPKYEHRLQEAFNLPRAETALLCVLLLRGPQTPVRLPRHGIYGNAPKEAQFLAVGIHALDQGFQVGRISLAVKLNLKCAAVGRVLVAINGVSHLPEIAAQLALLAALDGHTHDRHGDRRQDHQDGHGHDELGQREAVPRPVAT